MIYIILSNMLNFYMISEPCWSNGHGFESHHPYLFDKNQAQNNIDLYKFQAQKPFT